MRIDLDHETLLTLRRVLDTIAPVAHKVGLDPDAVAKLHRAVPDPVWCSHCDAEPVRANGICSPCESYDRKYGVLPPHEVLVKRQIRKDERRCA